MKRKLRALTIFDEAAERAAVDELEVDVRVPSVRWINEILLNNICYTIIDARKIYAILL